jgi:selenocysteine-specific elongation factor
MTMSDIRTLIDTSRKWAVPICEYLDDSGFTKREGDLRILVV